ncbi:tellurite resistance TerB family protein [Deinococcus cellulosilyticus]|uniref:Tellurium resistance protein TerB n=1 Tax=Deinococcus cellulosilyticus (strain DSM 18568 / NBRC 106333 / KACC 11606 / 5516J-15) TaxID=1223518 RepID=A0A511MUZ2_DEIC1|nr:TerB family tellurite resistance protein [Deinococcus cellulosilyticus]GEM44402.1 tellurium resistance protein TerB [Deinococcus cellulosilyticus NBRC 106333 = KACC 11606]
MSFFNKLKGAAQSLAGDLQKSAKQFMNREFAEASMAACALIAAADGKIDPTERSKTAQFIMSNSMLQSFDVATLKQKFDFYCGKLEQDYDFGKIEAIQAVSKLKSKPDAARAAVQVALVIANADGNFDDKERQAVREICNAVGINGSEFGV